MRNEVTLVMKEERKERESLFDTETRDASLRVEVAQAWNGQSLSPEEKNSSGYVCICLYYEKSFRQHTSAGIDVRVNPTTSINPSRAHEPGDRVWR
jgi:hypothetical protein